MTNVLIPYSFTPGTKAKASEVNADFNALANAVTENNEAVNTKITEATTNLETQITSATSTKLETDFTNSQNITNCILKAPNGVLTYATNILTVKSGLNVLIPNGKTSDNAFSNTSFTLENDITLSIDTAYSKRYVFLKSNSTIVTATSFVESTTQPSGSYVAWLNPTENKMYLSDANGSFTQISMALIAHKFTTTSTAITMIEEYYPLNLLKATDSHKISTWGMPDYNSGMTTHIPYTAPDNGYLWIATGSSSGQHASGYIDNVLVCDNYVGNSDHNSSTTVPIAKGSVFTSSTCIGLLFYPLKGVE